MSRFSLMKYLPTRSELREHRLLKPVAHLLEREEIWHLNRRSVAGAVFIGLFTAFLPLPGQMAIAAVLAIFARCNVPLAVGLVWISNPLTMPPMFYFAYRLGAWLLNMQLETHAIDMSLTWLWANFGAIGWPFLFGCLVCGWVLAITGWVFTHFIWRLHIISRWRERRLRRIARRLQTSEALSPDQSPKP